MALLVIAPYFIGPLWGREFPASATEEKTQINNETKMTILVRMANLPIVLLEAFLDPAIKIVLAQPIFDLYIVTY